MANGYFERGEVYWVNMGSGYAAEKGVGRPAVIVSKDESNNASPCVMVALLTTKDHGKPWEVFTDVSGRDSWIMCNEVMTYDKARFGKYIGKLTTTEMRAVEDGLELVFDLGYADTEVLNAKDREIDRLKAEIAELTGEVAREQARVIEVQAKHEDELLSYKLENTMWQKCYDKTMDMLVRTTVEGTYASRIVRETPVGQEIPAPSVAHENPPAEPVLKTPVADVPVDELVDINHCAKRDLMEVGFSEAIARAVIAARPFETVEDLKTVPYMNKKKYQILAPKVCCTPLEIIEVKELGIPEVPESPEEPETVEKLNINDCLGRELHEKTGVALSTAYCITGYRRANGPYGKLEDILNAKQVYPVTLDKLRDKVFCGPYNGEKQAPMGRKVKIEVEPYTGEKININTATAAEIHEKTGLSMTICYSITGCRKRDGNYRSVEDLANVPRFTEYHMMKYGPMFEV